MPYKYSTKAKENEAKAIGIALPISTKFSIEVCDQIRGKDIEKAKRFLEEVIALKKPVPLKRFNKDQTHKRGIAAGRFPVKCCKEILKLLKSAEANGQFKGLSSGSMVIRHISAQHGPKVMRVGRKRRIQAKRTHIEIILAEQKVTGKTETKKAAEKPKAEPKQEAAKTEKPKTEKPKTEKPKTEKPKTEKPKTEETKQQKTEQKKPVAEKPKQEPVKPKQEAEKQTELKKPTNEVKKE
jgi:large subunit ribosomal protein L22